MGQAWTPVPTVKPVKPSANWLVLLQVAGFHGLRIQSSCLRIFLDRFDLV
jgi:hypothetical protein